MNQQGAEGKGVGLVNTVTSQRQGAWRVWRVTDRLARMRSVLRPLVLACLLLLQACQAGQNIAAARRATLEFGASAAAGRYNEIYERAGSELKRSATQAAFVGVLETVAKKLGRCTQRTEVGGGMTDDPVHGRFVTLNYETQYQGGKADERFMWRVEGGKPQLLRYDIRSPALTGPDYLGN
jgi:hypothetical protein